MATPKNRVNVSTTQKTTESMQSGDWDLKFEYESLSGEAPAEVRVTGNNKTGGSLYITRSATQNQVIFNNSEFDSSVASAVMTEIAAIVAAPQA